MHFPVHIPATVESMVIMMGGTRRITAIEVTMVATVVRHCSRTGQQRSDQGTHNSNAFHTRLLLIPRHFDVGAGCGAGG
jgi:hypothetical protein